MKTRNFSIHFLYLSFNNNSILDSTYPADDKSLNGYHTLIMYKYIIKLLKIKVAVKAASVIREFLSLLEFPITRSIIHDAFKCSNYFNCRPKGNCITIAYYGCIS